MKSVAVARVAGPGPELPPKAGHGDRRSADRACLWLAAALALAAVAHRLWLAASQFILTTDTGTLALMALNILKGERPLFLYGFSYSGAPLAYLTALSFRWFGVSLFSLALPTAVLAGLWVWFSFLLFRRLGGSAAGVAAALLFACPDRMTSWYTQTPYSSYGAFLALTTAILWLAVEVEARDLRGWRLALGMSVLGGMGGLALWTNALSFPYLAVAAVPVLIHLARHRFRPGMLAAAFAGGCGCLLAASPLWIMAGKIASGQTAQWRLAPAWVAENAVTLFNTTVPMFFEWATAGRAIRFGGWIFLAAAWAVGLGNLARPRRQAPRWRALLPLLLLAVFLICFLPHRLAGAPVPRYVLPFWTVSLAVALALPMGAASVRLRGAAALLLGVWVAWNVHGAVALARVARPDRAERLARRAALTARVEKLGARHATLLGDYFFQAEANGLSFLARERVRYAAAGRERYLPHAQAADREPVRVYLCQQSFLPAARASLAALGADWRETPVDHTVTILHDLRPPRRSRRWIAGHEIRGRCEAGLAGVCADILDHDLSTAVTGAPDGPRRFFLDLGRVRPVCGLDLLPRDAGGLRLPTHGEVAISVDGVAFFPVVPWMARVPVAYTAGDGVYIGGSGGRAAFAFAPTPARYVRVTGASPGGRPLEAPVNGRDGRPRVAPVEWEVAEVRLYEASDGHAAEPTAGVADLIGYLDGMGVVFTACDRWLSARLLERQPLGAPPVAFPLFEYPGELRGDQSGAQHWGLLPAAGTAVVVARELADAQAAVLRQALGSGASGLRSDHGAYVSFVFSPLATTNPPVLLWDGAMLTPARAAAGQH